MLVLRQRGGGLKTPETRGGERKNFYIDRGKIPQYVLYSIVEIVHTGKYCSRKRNYRKKKESMFEANTNTRGILGHGGGRQEGGRKWAGRGGGILIFSAGGEALFAGGGGKGTEKLQKEP